MTEFVRGAPIPCPHCHRTNDSHARAGDRPTPGDFGICWGCGEVAMYDTDALGQLTMRLPTPEEAVELAANPEVASMTAARVGASSPLAANRRVRRPR